MRPGAARVCEPHARPVWSCEWADEGSLSSEAWQTMQLCLVREIAAGLAVYCRAEGC
jgi:hypothetical protein